MRNLEIFLRYFLTSRQVFLQLLLLAYNHDRNPPDGLVNTSVVTGKPVVGVISLNAFLLSFVLAFLSSSFLN